MADFSLKKINSLGQTLTAKEAIKIVIEYTLQEEEEGKDFDKEKSTIINALSSSYAREYNFYSSLAHSLKFIFLDFQTVFLDLKIKAAYLSKVHYVLLVSGLAQQAEKMLRLSPIIIPLSEYQQKLEEEKQKRLKEVMSIKELAKSETYQVLLKECKISKNEYSEQESLSDAIKNIGKTHETLVEECFQKLADFERSRIARESERKPEDISDEEVKKYIAAHTNLLDKATPELKEIYEKEFATQMERLQKLITDGVLLAGKEKDSEGIITESIYNNIHLFSDQWIKRYVDDVETYEIGEEDENGYFHRYAASSDTFYERSKDKKSFYDIEFYFTKDLLEILQVLKPINEKSIIGSPKVFTFQSKNHEATIKTMLKEVQELIIKLWSYMEAIRKIEQDFFDGLETISRKGLFTYAFIEAKEIIDDHNSSMQKVLDLYQDRLWNKDTIQDFDSFLLSYTTNFDAKQVEEIYQELVSQAQEKSGYRR